MKKSCVAFLFVVIIFFSVSGVQSFEKGVCKLLNQQCINDTECCSGNCRKYFSIVTKYCTDFHDHCLLLAGLKEMFVKPEFKDVDCVMTNDTAERTGDASRAERGFGVPHAAYSVYEPGTVVTVKRDGKTFDVVIDDRLGNATDPAMSNRTVILSGPAAQALDVQGTVKCQVTSRVLSNHPMLKKSLYIVPAVGFVATAWAFLRFVGFGIL